LSSRTEKKEQLRAERLAREKTAASAARRKRIVGYGLAGVLAIAALVAVVLVVMSGGSSGGGGKGPDGSEDTAELGEVAPEQTIPAATAAARDLDKAAKAAGCQVETNPEEGSKHVETTVTYKANPPTSGDHFPVPAEDGSYPEPPPIEQLVHSLEHGRIYLQYSPDASEEVKGQLQALFNEDPYHMILAPNTTGMPYLIAATTWNEVIGCEEMTDGVFDALRAFRDQYRDQGPEFVP
jgi:uncharacterized protein DUF3105